LKTKRDSRNSSKDRFTLLENHMLCIIIFELSQTILWETQKKILILLELHRKFLDDPYVQYHVTRNFPKKTIWFLPCTIMLWMYDNNLPRATKDRNLDSDLLWMSALYGFRLSLDFAIQCQWHHEEMLLSAFMIWFGKYW